MARKKVKKVWVAPDWLPALRKVLKTKTGKAKAFVLELVGMSGGKDYKAPHAPRGTSPRGHYLPRQVMLWGGAAAEDGVVARRLFKGHRA